MVFTFPWYQAILLPLFFVAIGGLGVYFWRRGDRFRGGACAAIGLVGFLTAGPSMFIDRVVVDDQGVHQSTGFWFNKTNKGFFYDEVESLTLLSEIRRSTRGQRLVGGVENELWQVATKAGNTRIIDPGDLWARHTEEILPVVRKQGITVIDRR